MSFEAVPIHYKEDTFNKLGSVSGSVTKTIEKVAEEINEVFQRGGMLRGLIEVDLPSCSDEGALQKEGPGVIVIVEYPQAMSEASVQ